MSAEESEAEREEKRRNAGEQLVQKILACQHPRLAYIADCSLTLGHLKVAATCNAQQNAASRLLTRW
jgi:hypothetical protein